MCWCFESDYSESEVHCYYEFWFSAHSYAAEEIFKHDRLFSLVYFSLCCDHQVSADLQDFIEQITMQWL